MKIFTFDLLSDEDVIIVNASIEGKFKFRLALDTAASIQLLTVIFYIFLVTNLKTVRLNRKLKLPTELLLLRLMTLSNLNV